MTHNMCYNKCKTMNFVTKKTYLEVNFIIWKKWTSTVVVRKSDNLGSENSGTIRVVETLLKNFGQQKITSLSWLHKRWSCTNIMVPTTQFRTMFVFCELQLCQRTSRKNVMAVMQQFAYQKKMVLYWKHSLKIVSVKIKITL